MSSLYSDPMVIHPPPLGTILRRLGRKGGEHQAVATRIFSMLVRMKPLVPFTAGIRRECWVALTVSFLFLFLCGCCG
jgi:hypothetical protein